MFLTQGACYMATKSDGDLRTRMLAIASKTWMGWVGLYVVATVFGFFDAPHLTEGTLANPLFWILFVGFLASILYLPLAIRGATPLKALLVSSAAILTMIGMAAVSLFPYLLPARNELAHSLTAGDHSSTETTLTTMLIIALIGMPVVLAYTVFIYRVFKGKVVLDAHSY